MLVDVPLEQAAEDLKDAILWLRKQPTEPPAVQEGLISWVKDWQADFNANRQAAEIIVEAMARYTLQLKAQGASPRTLSGVYDDLNAAGMLVMMYDAPKGKNSERILSHFDTPPWPLGRWIMSRSSSPWPRATGAGSPRSSGSARTPRPQR